ncbi:MAG TPA: uroporphyrinogen-III synthase [Burkholderiaceae bacterium]
MNYSATVVVTRPLVQSEELLQGIEAMGRHAVLFPLLEILPLPDLAPLQAALSAIRDYALVAFVSPNAIDAALAAMPIWPSGVAIAIMGEGSRRALARHGINEGNSVIFSPQDVRTDSETLLAVLDIASLRGRKVMIVRGETGRELLADRLREQGIEVVQVAAYRRIAPLFDSARQSQLASLLEGKSDWIVTSSEAVRNLVNATRELSQRPGMDGVVAKMQQQRLIVPHARIAESAHSEGFLNISLTASGDAALLAALQSLP